MTSTPRRTILNYGALLAAGALVGAQASAAHAGEYGYEYSYSLKASGIGASDSNLTGNEIFNKVNPNLSWLFPIDGMVDNPQVHQKINLGFMIVGYDKGPVEVIEVGERHFSLRSLEGHLEGPGNIITFTFSAEGEQLTIRADGPNTAPPGTELLPKLFWKTFSDNISHHIHPYQGYPGSESQEG